MIVEIWTLAVKSPGSSCFGATTVHATKADAIDHLRESLYRGADFDPEPLAYGLDGMFDSIRNEDLVSTFEFYDYEVNLDSHHVVPRRLSADQLGIIYDALREMSLEGGTMDWNVERADAEHLVAGALDAARSKDPNGYWG